LGLPERFLRTVAPGHESRTGGRSTQYVDATTFREPEGDSVPTLETAGGAILTDGVFARVDLDALAAPVALDGAASGALCSEESPA
jgi:hypothetical protein